MLQKNWINLHHKSQIPFANRSAFDTPEHEEICETLWLK